MVAETNELDAVREFVYNAAGQLVRRIDREDRVVVYKYDPQGRNTAEIWYARRDRRRRRPEPTRHDLLHLRRLGPPADRLQPFIPFNTLRTIPTPYEYDDLGRVIEETQEVAGLDTVVFTYKYDAGGRLTQSATTIDSTADAVTDYAYDSLGRVTRIEQYGVIGGNPVAEKRIDLTYDARSQYAAISYYSDLDGGSGNLVMTATYAYDPSGRLTELVYTDATPEEIREFEWIYDAAGRIVAHDSDIDSEDVTDYGYDATGQLTSADYDTGSDESYTYDSNGNRVPGRWRRQLHDRRQQPDRLRRHIHLPLRRRGQPPLPADRRRRPDDRRPELGRHRHHRVSPGTIATVWPKSPTIRPSRSTTPKRPTAWSITSTTASTTVSARSTTPTATATWTARSVTSGNSGPLSLPGEGQGEGGAVKGNVALDFIDADGVGETESLELAHRYLWGQMVDQLLAQETADDGGVEDVLYPVRDNLGSIRSLVKYDGDIAATYSYGHVRQCHGPSRQPLGHPLSLHLPRIRPNNRLLLTTTPAGTIRRSGSSHRLTQLVLVLTISTFTVTVVITR